MKECGEIMYDGITLSSGNDEDYKDKLTFDEFKENIIEIYNLFEEFCKAESHKLSKKNSMIRPVKIGYDIEHKPYGKYQLVLELKKIDCEKFMPNICDECANYNNPLGCCELDAEPRDCSYFERIEE